MEESATLIVKSNLIQIVKDFKNIVKFDPESDLQ